MTWLSDLWNRSGPWCDKCGAPILNGRTEFMRALLAENKLLREALLDQWESNHFEHCGRLPHPEGHRCHWEPPAVLGMTTAEAYAALEASRKISERKRA